MDINHLINEKIIEEEEKYKHYKKKYDDTFEKYKDCNAGLLKLKLVPVWKNMIKHEYKLSALKELKEVINFDIKSYEYENE